MNTNEIVKSVEKETTFYLNELANVDMEQLCRKPNAEEWSLGQMMMHLVKSAHLQLRNLEACRDLSNSAVRVDGAKNDRGEAAYREGSSPPIRIQVPSTIPNYTPAQPNSHDEIRAGMEDVVSRMRSVASTVDDIPGANKVEHPGLGYLNAKEWFQLIEMHYRHHRHQLGRLKEFLGA